MLLTFRPITCEVQSIKVKIYWISFWQIFPDAYNCLSEKKIKANFTEKALTIRYSVLISLMSSSVTSLLPNRLTIDYFKAKVSIVSFEGMCSSTPKLDPLRTRWSESCKLINSYVLYPLPVFLGSDSVNGLDPKLRCNSYVCSFLRLCLHTVWIFFLRKAETTETTKL